MYPQFSVRLQAEDGSKDTALLSSRARSKERSSTNSLLLEAAVLCLSLHGTCLCEWTPKTASEETFVYAGVGGGVLRNNELCTWEGSCMQRSGILFCSHSTQGFCFPRKWSFSLTPVMLEACYCGPLVFQKAVQWHCLWKLKSWKFSLLLAKCCFFLFYSADGVWHRVDLRANNSSLFCSRRHLP